jgi:hypothetical protein
METAYGLYVYHIDASKLKDSILVAQWEAENNALLEKRKIAGSKNAKTKWAKGSSGNPTGQSNLLHPEHSKMQQPHPREICYKPLHTKLLQTPHSKLLHRPYPMTPAPLAQVMTLPLLAER